MAILNPNQPQGNNSSGTPYQPQTSYAPATGSAGNSGAGLTPFQQGEQQYANAYGTQNSILAPGALAAVANQTGGSAQPQQPDIAGTRQYLANPSYVQDPTQTVAGQQLNDVYSNLVDIAQGLVNRAPSNYTISPTSVGQAPTASAATANAAASTAPVAGAPGLGTASSWSPAQGAASQGSASYMAPGSMGPAYGTGAQLNPVSGGFAIGGPGQISTAGDAAWQAQQQQLANILGTQAAGGGVSPADLQLQRGAEQNLAQQMSVLGSQRGSLNAALATRSAADQAAAISANLNQQMGIQRAQETLNAQQALGQVLGTGRAQAQNYNLAQAGLSQGVNMANIANAQAAQLQNAQLLEQTGLANLGSRNAATAMNVQNAQGAAIQNLAAQMAAAQFNAGQAQGMTIQDLTARNVQLLQNQAAANAANQSNAAASQAMTTTNLANELAVQQQNAQLAGQFGLANLGNAQQTALANQGAINQANLANAALAGQYGLTQAQLNQQTALANQQLAFQANNQYFGQTMGALGAMGSVAQAQQAADFAANQLGVNQNTALSGIQAGAYANAAQANANLLGAGLGTLGTLGMILAMSSDENLKEGIEDGNPMAASFLKHYASFDVQPLDPTRYIPQVTTGGGGGLAAGINKMNQGMLSAATMLKARGIAADKATNQAAGMAASQAADTASQLGLGYGNGTLPPPMMSDEQAKVANARADAAEAKLDALMSPTQALPAWNGGDPNAGYGAPTSMSAPMLISGPIGGGVSGGGLVNPGSYTQAGFVPGAVTDQGSLTSMGGFAPGAAGAMGSVTPGAVSGGGTSGGSYAAAPWLQMQSPGGIVGSVGGHLVGNGYVTPFPTVTGATMTAPGGIVGSMGGHLVGNGYTNPITNRIPVTAPGNVSMASNLANLGALNLVRPTVQTPGNVSMASNLANLGAIAPAGSTPATTAPTGFHPTISNVLSDEEQKTPPDESGGHADVEEMLNKLHAYEYKYKNPNMPGARPGPQLGVMAQDLEKSPMGAQFVMNTPQGKMVDYGKAASAMMASLAYHNDKLNEHERLLRSLSGGEK